ncbi:MAG: FAD-binding protein [Gemmatimonadota bacterium]|nr:FAD-binding protein [Gemmatimonadota bacterium]
MPIRVPGFRGRLSQDPSDLHTVSRSTGPVSMTPWAVAVPDDLKDVEALVRHASGEGWHLIPRGAATGMPGGNVGRGVVVDLTQGFGQLDPVDHERNTLRVGAGVVLARAITTPAPTRRVFRS